MTPADLHAWQAALPTDFDLLVILLAQLQTEWITVHALILPTPYLVYGGEVKARIHTLNHQIRIIEHRLLG